MKRYFLVACLTGFAITANAQVIRVPAGKKFQVVMSSTATTSVTVMGQTIDNINDLSAVQDYTIQSVSKTGFAMTMVTKKISGSVSIMGHEQKFDSDDEATKNSPQMTGPLSYIGKPQEIKVENGKVTTSEEMNRMLSSIGMNADIEGEVAKLFFMPTFEGVKQGSGWTDSTVAEGFKIVNQYLVTSVTGDQVEMRVATDTRMNTTIKQAGMDVQADMKGFSTSTRTYDKKTGLLITEKGASEITGTADGMGVKAPMTVKSTSLITVK